MGEAHEFGIAEQGIALEAQVEAFADGYQPKGRERGEEGGQQEYRQRPQPLPPDGRACPPPGPRLVGKAQGLAPPFSSSAFNS